jgi:hypothetical protein
MASGEIGTSAAVDDAVAGLSNTPFTSPNEVEIFEETKYDHFYNILFFWNDDRIVFAFES